MNIDRLRTLSGPNVYSSRPVLLVVLDFDGDSERLERGADQLVCALDRLLPALRSAGEAWDDGAVLLHPGMTLVDLVAAAACELLRLADLPARRTTPLTTNDPFRGGFGIELGAEQATRFLVEAAVDLVDALRAGRDFPVADRVAEARRIAGRTELGPSTRAIVEAAERRGIPWARVGGGSLVQLGYGVNRRFLQAALTDRTSCIAVDIAADKQLTKAMLEQASIPVPRGLRADTIEEALEAFAALGAPVAVKPLDGQQGKGVSLGLATAEEVAAAFEGARALSRAVLVEEMLEGRDFRVLVVDGRVVAASERFGAHVVGDGVRTVAELVELVNRDPRRGEGHEKPLTRIVADAAVVACLGRQGLALDAVPEQGRVVSLCDGANLSKGGVARDVTDRLHPSVARVCERAARAVGLDVCGVDLVAEGIEAPLEPGRGGIVELNAAPGLRMHCHPSEGAARDVGGAIIDALYPDGAPSRVPIISITGTNGKTTTTRMIAHAVARSGRTVGMTTTDGIWVGGERVATGDTTGPVSARTVLGDPTVEVAVLETARGGIVRRGLGYDWADVAIVTNVQADHIGQDGITSVDDVLRIKSVVAERVRPGGTLVLNADDERLATLPERNGRLGAGRHVVYFSLHESSVVVKRHLSHGGRAYTLREDGWILERDGAAERPLVRAPELPVTVGGTADYHVANAMAAIAACRAYGMEPEEVAAAMLEFANGSHNAGRTNLYRVGSRYVLVDYGHNPDAYRAVARMVSRWGRPTACLLSVPGDRWDSVVEEIGRVAAASFDRVVISEDLDRRGRAPGELPAILEAAVRAEAPSRPCEVVPDQRAALRRALETAAPDEVVVVLYEKLVPIEEVLRAHGAVAVESPLEAVAEPRMTA